MPLNDRSQKVTRAGYTPRRHRVRTRALLAGAVVVASLAVAASAASRPTGGSASGTPITVWTDSIRLPAFKLYQKAHPNVPMKIVTWDGNGNGPATLQTKLNLFNRTGKGWPDVVFSQTPGHLVHRIEADDFAAPLDALLPASTVRGYPKRVMASCRVNGKIYCVQNDVAQNVLWYNATLMEQFGNPSRRRGGVQGDRFESRQGAPRLHHRRARQQHDADVSLGAGAEYQPVAGGKLLINMKSPLCTRAVNMLDELLAAKAVMPLSEYAPGFTKKYAVPNKILMMVGASWFGEFMFRETFKTPAGQTAAAAPLRWASDPTTWTGMIGGGIYMVSRHAADQKAAADIVNWIVTSPHLPGHGTHLSGVRPGRQVVAQEARGQLLRLADRARVQGGREHRLSRVRLREVL